MVNVEERYEGRVVVATLDLPKGNVLTAAMIGELTDVVSRVQESPGARALVIGAEGRHFSFGASVEEHQADQVGDMLPAFHRLIGALVHCDVTTVAVVQGQCLGGGFELVLGCDLVFALPSARMGVPEITLGVFPPPASILLPAKIGPAAAQEMIATGASFDARRLRELGLVNRVLEEEGADDAVNAWVEKEVIPRSAASLRFANRASQRALRRLWDEDIGAVEKMYLEELMKTPDANEGIGAFLEKRRPRWES
ncbi:MAG: enoyl-CoA hydratase/isomerase family protein [Deltaproteobacteria bacterium]|nr:enoyl-CoA hydratase/isomerase family protein [Deltaproteobacteria bacterium]